MRPMNGWHCARALFAGVTNAVFFDAHLTLPIRATALRRYSLLSLSSSPSQASPRNTARISHASTAQFIRSHRSTNAFPDCQLRNTSKNAVVEEQDMDIFEELLGVGEEVGMGCHKAVITKKKARGKQKRRTSPLKPPVKSMAHGDLLQSYSKVVGHRPRKSKLKEEEYTLRTTEFAGDEKGRRLEEKALDLMDSYRCLLHDLQSAVPQQWSAIYLDLSINLYRHLEMCQEVREEMERVRLNSAPSNRSSRRGWMKLAPRKETMQRIVTQTVLPLYEHNEWSHDAKSDIIPPSQRTLLGRTCRTLGYAEVFADIGATADVDESQTTPTQAQRRPRPLTSKGLTVRKVPVSGHSVSLFKPSPQLRAQQSAFSFTGISTSYPDTSSAENDAGFSSVGQNTDTVGHSQTATGQDIHTADTEKGDPIEPDGPPPNRDNDEESSYSSDNESEAASESDANMEAEKHVALSYQIPAEVQSAALEAPPKTKASYWSQKLYRGPDDEKILTHYCETFEVAERVAKYFLNEKALGFDIEWKSTAIPTFPKQNASLIQLASEDRIALFHIALFRGTKPEQLVPPTLKKILESPDVLKVGVAIKADFTRLEKHLDIKARGVMELSRTHNLLEAEDPRQASHRLVSLARQVEQHLLLPLYKGEPLVDDPEPDTWVEKEKWLKRQRVRESDWSKRLDPDQVHYAAADAYAGLRLYDVLESKRKQMKPVPSRPRLCDDDPKAPPRSTMLSRKKARAAKVLKDAQAKAIAEALTRLPAEEPDEEDAEVYETAAEELDDDETKEDGSVSGSSFENSEQQGEESDEEYIPKRRDGIDIGPSVGKTEARARRIGRLDVGKLRATDLGYPRLPAQPSDEEEEEDKYADDELEEALMDMDIDADGEDLTTVDAAAAETTSDDVSVLDTDNEAETTTPPPSFHPLVVDTSSHSPQYIQATTWAQSYLQATIPSPGFLSQPSRIRATLPHLRAYHLWHIQSIGPEEIGGLLREPPLAVSTVTSYILQAVSLEPLEFDGEKLRSLLLSQSEGLRRGRWKWLSRKVGL
ncbi:hypothetical protein CC80DRAFT_450039 [Byssothecium circinans]|uniref:3'-5' exonuclease domain-containing protein n=1 Tax=Byssothecium circinans TaxID=147558 RepID=A0A6A5TMW8_9PLEO|nr:hypothetical protein CC80DRAFT_450039 [Byssothecium circinans]